MLVKQISVVHRVRGCCFTSCAVTCCSWYLLQTVKPMEKNASAAGLDDRAKHQHCHSQARKWWKQLPLTLLHELLLPAVHL